MFEMIACSFVVGVLFGIYYRIAGQTEIQVENIRKPR